MRFFFRKTVMRRLSSSSWSGLSLVFSRSRYSVVRSRGFLGVEGWTLRRLAGGGPSVRAQIWCCTERADDDGNGRRGGGSWGFSGEALPEGVVSVELGEGYLLDASN